MSWPVAVGALIEAWRDDYPGDSETAQEMLHVLLGEIGLMMSTALEPDLVGHEPAVSMDDALALVRRYLEEWPVRSRPDLSHWVIGEVAPENRS